MERELQLDGQKIHYSESGSGQPMILLHGWGCSSETLASIERFAAESYKTYNIDFPGFGKSPEPDGIWGVENYTRMLENFCRKLGISNPVILGHSFGGRVGILFSSRNPVDKLILVDAAGVKPKRPLKYYLKVYSYKLSKKMWLMLLGREKGMKKIEKIRSRRGSADYNSASPRMKAILSKVVNEDLKSVMPQISAPTLLLWGENDTATPVRDAKIMKKLIPDARVVVFPDAGHYSFLDARMSFFPVLNAFINPSPSTN